MENSDTSNVSTSIPQLLANDDLRISTYPNPVKEFLNVHVSQSGRSAYSLSVLDAGGKTVLSDKMTFTNSGAFSLSTKELAAGVYLIRVQNEHTVRSVKVIKH